jgi:transglutaminase-like putative cysteine protease
MARDFQPKLDLTVRVGCHLVYETTTRVPVLLNLKPRMDPRQAVQSEMITFGENLPAEEFEDSHGNIVYRLVLHPGCNQIRHDAIVSIPSLYDNQELPQNPAPIPLAELPPELLRYTLPSRYCDSDKLIAFAWQQFGQIEDGLPRVQAICDWVHNNVEYRFGSGSPEISAWDVIQRRFGVCRDFAHCTTALCRAMNLPARYVTGHLPDIGFIDPGTPMDFHAYFEVFLGGHWYTYDARFNVPRIGRIKVASGLDAVDAALSTSYGAAMLTHFEVWAYQVPAGSVTVGAPIDLSIRLDGTPEVRTDAA